MTKFAEVLRKVHEMEPRVQCITNFVTVNDCANIILAAGGTPSMAIILMKWQKHCPACRCWYVTWEPSH